jgi:hypothetical protein
MKTNELMEECRKKFNLDKENNKISLEIGPLYRAYMVGYNDACEKALEWLDANLYKLDSYETEIFDSIYITTNFDTKEQALTNLKQSLYPYSVEQIDNCIDIK